MTTISEPTLTEIKGGLRVHSTIDADVWHPATHEPAAYEWWYFDAVSDDGRDALVVIFLADFIFSPRYNRAASERLKNAQGHARETTPERFPAVVFCLYRDGRPIIRAINEATAADFSADTTRPACRIGQSSFRLDGDARAARRYVLTLDETLRRGRRLAAHFEWAVREGDFSEGDVSGVVASSSSSETREGAREETDRAAHVWNMVAPRCDVSGSIAVLDGDGRRASDETFRGTGYHDHNRDRRWMPSTIDAWQWGRAHFADTTAVFYRYREHADASLPTTRLFLVRDGALTAQHARAEATHLRRNHFGLRYPQSVRFRLEGENTGATLHFRQSPVVDSSYFYLRFLGEATLDTGRAAPQRAPAITEQLSPRALRWRWLDWLTSMRIGRHGRASFLK